LDHGGTPPIIMHQQPSLLAPATLRHVTRVSKRAALATKKQIWDSNDASIVAAQSAVDQWEQGYNALRGLLNMMGASAGGLYGAAKAGANGLEHGLLVPVRDWVLLPAFGGVEHVAVETIRFLQTEQCRALERAGLGVIQQVPYVGDNILAPVVCKGAEILKQSWKIAQYPIPSPSQVRDSVEFVMTGTKWCLAKSSREIMLYAKRADANITRTISHTQWKVLGSGPYATLNKRNKSEVLDHLCERYFSLDGVVARYELAAHIRTYNRHLYRDLVLTGLLRERGGQLTIYDEWLSSSPNYRESECSFLLKHNDDDSDGKNVDKEQSPEVIPLWFRLPNYNGQRPSKDTPWKQFNQKEGSLLEEFFYSSLKKMEDNEDKTTLTEPTADHKTGGNDEMKPASAKYKTEARWYDPDLENDLLLDQKRYAVTAFPCHREPGESDALELPPPLSLVMRPTLWRFHGPGDEVRRAVWFLDTQRNGLQPYGEGAQAVLEDAYMFLKWTITQPKQDGGILLTVEVPSPDESEYQLVQFSSLSSATAIGKGLKGAISLFKRRVYRGAYQEVDSDLEDDASVDTGLPEDATTAMDDYDPNILMLPEAEEDEADQEQVQEFVFEDSIPDPSFLRSDIQSKQKKVKSESMDEVQLESESDISDEIVYESASLAFPLEEINSRAEDSPNAMEDGGRIDHLVLVVHGIGEMMINVDIFGISKMPTIVDCCDFLRDNHAEVLNTRFSRRGRVEYLPVEWHEAFSIETKRRSLGSGLAEQTDSNFTINDVALRTIPQLRQFANDTLMDVLYFMSPEHHDIIIDIVVNEMNFVVERFKALTGFTGDTSVVGHSLGSIITWDILENQRVSNANVPSDKLAQMLHDVPERTISPSQVQSGATATEYTLDNDPESVSPLVEETVQRLSNYPQLSFNVDNAFMLGSPIAVFLMIRNPRKPLATDYTLGGCSQIFNIFHPYDPVAYRIEPLLDSRNAEIEPRIMSHWHGGYRFQYQTKRLWRRIISETLKTQETVVEGLESGFAALGLLNVSNDDSDEEEEIDAVYHDDPQVEMGSLNRGQRIDHMLQEKEIENANEYVAALAAHSSYWVEKDLSLFIAHQICLRSLELSSFAKDETG